MKNSIFKKFLVIASTSILAGLAHSNDVIEPIIFNKKTEHTLYYNHSSYEGSHTEKDIKDSILNGLNYWFDCSKQQVFLSNIETEFQIVWSNSLNNKEFGAANYKKQNNEIISFTIELNNNKNLTLLEIEKISAHEFGHILEIDHNIDNNSIMNFSATKMLSQLSNQEKDNSLCKQRLL